MPVEPAFAALARKGTHAAVVICRAEALREAARDTGVRALGPGSFGIAVPEIGLNASRAHLTPRPGKIALVSQSAALCRAVLDWAEPNGVGFSHIVGIGGNADIGFGIVLDWLARDPGTGAILLDIRRIKDRRVFLSAARAAARLRPVVAIRAGGLLLDPTGDADAALMPRCAAAACWACRGWRICWPRRKPSPAPARPAARRWPSSPTPSARPSSPPTPRCATGCGWPP